jgi:ribose/xylose/arabinose/galactoside ABC-type transport system permease subunit
MKNKKVLRWALEYGIVLVLVLLIVFFSTQNSRFFSVNVMMTILKQVAITGIASVGMTYVIITGGIDLSVGAIAGLTGIISSMLMLNGTNSFLACAIGLLAAIVLGALNALLITRLGLPPLIATLGVMTSARGLAFIISGGFSVVNFNPNFTNFSKSVLWFIPYPAILMVVIFLIAAFILNKMKIGRHIYGVGGNEEASRLSGINTKLVKSFAYIFCGFLSGVAGLLYLSRIGSGQAGAGSGYEMDAITSVVLGGVSITGGEGKLGMVAIGVLIMGVLKIGMVMMNINDYVQQVVSGIVMVFAEAFSLYSKKIRNNMAKEI